MHKKITQILGLLLVLFHGPLTAEEIEVDLLLYQVSDPDGTRQSLSRVMVTESMLRMDEIGEDALPGYLIYDRKERLISSVDPGNGSIMLIGPPDEEAAQPSRDIDIVVESRQLEEAPALAGKQPQEFDVKVYGDACLTLVAVPGMMNDAMQAIQEMNAVLAERHRRVADRGLNLDCRLTIDAFEPGLEYSKGLLLSLVGKGEIRQLVEYRQSTLIDSEVFEAPLDYRRFPMP